jgi:hypothetical protein
MAVEARKMDVSARWSRLVRGLRSVAARREAVAVFSLAIAIYGMARINQATPNGLGLIGDSFFYVTGAENLAAGRGFGRLRGGGEFAPTTHYPPGYSLAMAIPQLIGVDKLDSARWVNVGSFAVLILSATAVVYKATGSSLAALLVAALLGFSPVLLEVHAWVMSEALYLGLSGLALWLLFLYLDRGRREWLVVLAVVVASATLTRYVGLALTASLALAVLFQEGPRRARLQRLALFLTIALVPILAWFVRNAIHTGNLANRDLLWTPIGYSQLRSLGLHLLDWFGLRGLIAGRMMSLVLLLLIGAAGAGIAWRLWRSGKLPLRSSIESVLFGYALFHVAIVLVSLALVDAFIPIDNRILSPVHVAALVGAASLAGRSWQHLRYPVGAVLVGLLVLLAGRQALLQAQLAARLSQQTLGYANPAIGESDLIQAVRQLPSDVPLVSNGLSSLYFWADRYCYAIPVRIDVESGLPRPTYEAELEAMRRRFRDEWAVLVLFDPASWLPEYAPVEDLTTGLSLIGRFAEGDIYRFEGTQD